MNDGKAKGEMRTQFLSGYVVWVRHQAIKASRISGCLNETIWSNKYLRTETKVRIYKSIVRPTLTYAAETRTDTAKTRRLLEVTEMKTLR